MQSRWYEHNHLGNCRRSSFTDCPLFTHSEKVITATLHTEATSHFWLKGRRFHYFKPAEICMKGYVFRHWQNNNLPHPSPACPLIKPLRLGKSSDVMHWNKDLIMWARGMNISISLKISPKFVKFWNSKMAVLQICAWEIVPAKPKSCSILE